MYINKPVFEARNLLFQTPMKTAGQTGSDTKVLNTQTL